MEVPPPPPPGRNSLDKIEKSMLFLDHELEEFLSFRYRSEALIKWAYCILRKMRIGCVNVQYMCKICTRFAQDSLPMHNICTRFAQDCTYISNAQYMHKICARLYLFLQCAIFVQDCTSFLNAQYSARFTFFWGGEGAGRVRGLRVCHPPYHSPLIFKPKFKIFVTLPS